MTLLVELQISTISLERDLSVSKKSLDMADEKILSGQLGGSVAEHLPLAQVVILGSWD